MDEYNHLTNEQIHAEVQRRLAVGRPVGRLLDSLQNRGEPTVQYQAQRTTSDIAAHVRWKSYVGEPAPEETQELMKRRAWKDSQGETELEDNHELDQRVPRTDGNLKAKP